MKTLREVLLSRHRAATPKLDAVRKAAVAALRERPDAVSDDQRWPQTSAGAILRTLWRELFQPNQLTWVGLMAAWVLLAAVNLSQRDHSKFKAAKSAPEAGSMISFRDQQRLLNELFAESTPAAKVEAARPKIYLPKPRTEKIQLRTV